MSLNSFPSLFSDSVLWQQWGMKLLTGFSLTLQLSFSATFIGFLLGLLLACARLSPYRSLSGLALCYITFFRGTPLLCQLFFLYAGTGQVHETLKAWGLWWFFREAYSCALLAFVLNTAAYQGEILRGAMQSIPKGQNEAGKALGLKTPWILFAIIGPQALIIALRPLGNELISMIKASALASFTTIYDLLAVTKLAYSQTYDFTIYIYAAMLYLIVVVMVEAVWRILGKRLARHLPPE